MPKIDTSAPSSSGPASTTTRAPWSHCAALGRLAASEQAFAVGSHSDDPFFERHGQAQPHGMVIGQDDQLALYLPDIARLDRDPDVIARDVHDIAVELDLHAAAGPRAVASRSACRSWAFQQFTVSLSE